MGFADEACTLCGRPAQLNVGGDGHGLVALSDDEPVGRVCDTCADEKLDGVPDGETPDGETPDGETPDSEACIVCGADADYAHVGLTVERTAEGAVPVVEREGEETPILCGMHFEELQE